MGSIRSPTTTVRVGGTGSPSWSSGVKPGYSTKATVVSGCAWVVNGTSPLCCSTGELLVLSSGHDLADGVDHQLRLLELNVMAAALGHHQPSPRRQPGQFGLQLLPQLLVGLIHLGSQVRHGHGLAVAEYDQREVPEAGDVGGGEFGVDGLDGLLFGDEGLDVFGAGRDQRPEGVSG